MLVRIEPISTFITAPSLGFIGATTILTRGGFILGDKVEDCIQLESLRELVVKELTTWPVSNLTAQRVNDKYLPV